MNRYQTWLTKSWNHVSCDCLWENVWQFYLLFIVTRSYITILRGLRQYYEFPVILSDLRLCYQCVLRQLRAKSKTRAMIARCKFIEFVAGKKFS